MSCRLTWPAVVPVPPTPSGAGGLVGEVATCVVGMHACCVHQSDGRVRCGYDGATRPASHRESGRPSRRGHRKLKQATWCAPSLRLRGLVRGDKSHYWHTTCSGGVRARGLDPAAATLRLGLQNVSVMRGGGRRRITSTQTIHT